MALDAISIVTFGLRTTTASEFSLRMVSHGLIGVLTGIAEAADAVYFYMSKRRRRR